MAGSIARLLGVLVGFGLICSACSGRSTTTTTPAATTPMGEAGADAGTFCTPGARRCDGHEIKRCDDTGAEEVVDSDCLSGECQMRAGAPACTPTACKPGLAMCDGSLVTTCKPDGSGPEPGRIDCGTSKQSCVAGKCTDVQCVAGAASCHDGDLYVCSSDGTSLTLSDHCKDNEVCSDDSSACLTLICEPDKITCNGTRVTTCNSLGTGWLSASTDCAGQGKTCINGACDTRVCVPSTSFCQDADLYQCDPTGSSSTLSKTCGAGEHCRVTPAGLYAYCESDACVPGTTVCSGDLIKTCNADGTLPTDGVACSKDEYCENAACTPRLCILNSYYCNQQSIYLCQSNGPLLSTQCDPGTACQALLPNVDLGLDSSYYSELVWCSAPTCPPGQSGCVLDKIGTCATDGATLATVTSDCAADGKVCTTDATCAASASDTLGADEVTQSFPADNVLADVINVRSSRKLTEIQTWLVFNSPRDLHWVIYELVGSDFVPRADIKTTESSSAGFVSSGLLSFDYELVAGTRYALGVIISGGDSLIVEDSTPFGGNPSFGDLLGITSAYDDGLSFSAAGGFYQYLVARMKVITVAP